MARPDPCATVGSRGATALRLLACLAAGLVPAACGSQDSIGPFQVGQIVGGGTKQMAAVQPVAGFLPNPSLLQPGQQGQPDLIYRSPTANFAGYRSVMLEPVAIWTSPGSPLSQEPQTQRRALANTFYSDLYTALSQHCQMTKTPSAGTLRTRVALVDAKSSNAVEDTVATYAPYVGAAYGAASLAFNHGVGYFAGTATAEAYGTDAGSGTLLFQAVDRRGGTTAMLENTLDNWLDVHHAFTALSNEITTKLQQMGVCRT
jgi:hypothetical protein